MLLGGAAGAGQICGARGAALPEAWLSRISGRAEIERLALELGRIQRR